MKTQRVLVTGATGYIGGRLIPRLIESGYHVHAMSRSRSKLSDRPWADHDRVTLVEGDAQEQSSLVSACENIDVVYYLIHSMTSGDHDFREADRTAAENMVEATNKRDVNRIIYLGGLGEDQPEASEHLESRAEVGRILNGADADTTILKAGVILGSGSASFELIRYLVERLPVMITPKWVRTRCQPIAVRNVLTYLTGLLDHPETAGEEYDIGGPDVTNYQELIETYAKVAQLSPRLIVPVPFLTPYLSSLWLHFVTPVPTSMARALIEGLSTEVVCQENRIRKIISQDLLSVETAIERAMEREQNHNIKTHWSDAGSMPPAEWTDEADPDWAGGTVYEDRRVVDINGDADEVWRRVRSIGGDTGWYFADWLWKIRGWLDRLVGGFGLRRGRQHTNKTKVGDAIGFWRILRMEDHKRLTLLSEMKLPGEAILEFELSDNDDQSVELTQTARFWPRGLSGLLYWYLVYPFHSLVFNGMLRGIGNSDSLSIKDGPTKITD